MLGDRRNCAGMEQEVRRVGRGGWLCVGESGVADSSQQDETQGRGVPCRRQQVRLSETSGTQFGSCSCFFRFSGHCGSFVSCISTPGHVQISIAIPGMLKQQLIEDHDAVKEDKNIPMPRTPCIISILDAYKEYARKQSQQSQTTPDIDEQVAHGIRNYFDRTLALVRPSAFSNTPVGICSHLAAVLSHTKQHIQHGDSSPTQTSPEIVMQSYHMCVCVQLLLYNEERAQADGLLKNGDSPSSIYGAEHLLRLFLKLPELLPIENTTEEQYRLLQTKLHELLEFLASRREEYFLPISSYTKAEGPSTHAAPTQPAAAPPPAAPVPSAQPAALLPSDVAAAVAPAPGAVKLASQPPLSAATLAQMPQPMQH